MEQTNLQLLISEHVRVFTVTLHIFLTLSEREFISKYVMMIIR